MLALVLNAIAPIDTAPLQAAERPLPVPGPGEVRVRVVPFSERCPLIGKLLPDRRGSVLSYTRCGRVLARCRSYTQPRSLQAWATRAIAIV